MTKHAPIQLPDETYERLDRVAEWTGAAPLTHVLKALEAYLEDVEDIRMAEEALTDHERNGRATISLDELSRRLGLDD